MSLLQQLEQPAVRDLYCACFGQDLMASGYNVASFGEVTTCFPHLKGWFLDLDKDPNKLLDHISLLKSTRLGIYYEALWEYYLRYAGVADLLAKNRQVRKNKNTLGEYDFIYYCRRRQCHVHLETAIKFYLGVLSNNEDNRPSQQNAWIGPACRDRLDIKYTALLGRQMKLSTTDEGAESLSQIEVGRVRSELALKGMLFYPLCCSSRQGPIDCQPDHSKGIWLRGNELSLLLSKEENSRWTILERRQWCSPYLFNDKSKVLTAEELEWFILNYFPEDAGDSHFSPIQVAEMAEINSRQEKQRYFVVANDWNQPL